MQRGDWYKSFISSESPVRTIEIYYHITDIINDEILLVDEYTYYLNLRKYVKISKTPARFKSKWWLEQIIRNNVYPVEKGKIPFILYI